jgi:hypothetical protein
MDVSASRRTRTARQLVVQSVDSSALVVFAVRHLERYRLDARSVLLLVSERIGVSEFLGREASEWAGNVVELTGSNGIDDRGCDCVAMLPANASTRRTSEGALLISAADRAMSSRPCSASDKTNAPQATWRAGTFGGIRSNIPLKLRIDVVRPAG